MFAGRFFSSALLFTVGAGTPPNPNADLESEVVAAVQALRAESNYSWEVQYKTVAEDKRRAARVNASRPPTEAGEIQKDGSASFRIHASDRWPMQQVVRHKTNPRRVDTPDGWLTESEVVRLRRNTSATEMVEFGGRNLFKRELLTHASAALRFVPPDEALTLLLRDIERFERVGDYIVGFMGEAGERRLGSRPRELWTIVFFRISGGALHEYLVHTDHSTAGDPRTTRRASVSGNAVRIFNVGRTTVTTNGR